MRAAAAEIVAMGAGWVVMKGGHRAGPEVTDLLHDGREFWEFRAPRIATTSTHGTGCTLASAIAARLALGDAVPEAVGAAKEYLHEAIAQARPIGRGHGPVHHFHGWYSVAGELEPVVAAIRAELTAKSAAREVGLARRGRRFAPRPTRSARSTARSRGRGAAGRRGRAALRAARRGAGGHPDLLHGGFVHDAAKEYAEARLVLALVAWRPAARPARARRRPGQLPARAGRAVGELRRRLLDYLRRGQVERCEPLLEAMDEIYTQLVTIDFPDAMTAGLRRATDAARGILEKTRGDLTVAIRQRDLESRLASLRGATERRTRAQKIRRAPSNLSARLRCFTGTSAGLAAVLLDRRPTRGGVLNRLGLATPTITVEPFGSTDSPEGHNLHADDAGCQRP